MSEQWGFETRQIHAGASPDPATGARAVPIYQTTSYQFRDSAHAANLFALAEIGNIYTRIMNPTQLVLEARVNSLEGGCTTAVGLPGHAGRQFRPVGRDAGDPHPGRGGQPPRLVAVALRRYLQPVALHVAEAGHRGHLRRRSPRSRAVEVGDPPEHQGVLRRDAGQPEERRVRHRGGVQGRSRPRHPADDRQHRADAVPDPADRVGRRHRASTRSPSSWAATARRSPGRSPTAASSTSARAGRFPNFIEPDPSYHGLAYWPALGHGSYILKARVQLLRDLGMAISPFNAFQILQGIETLSLRMERHFANADKVADFLGGQRRGRVDRLRRPALEPVARAGQAVRRRPGLRLGPRLRPQGRARRRARSSPRRCSCTATSPTSATSAAWSSTRPRPPTASSPRQSRSPPASTPGSCGCRSGSNRSRTSSPTSNSASPRSPADARRAVIRSAKVENQ